MLRSVKTKDLIFVGLQMLILVLFLVLPPSLSWGGYEIIRTVGMVLLIMGLAVILISWYQIRKSLTPFPTPLSRGKLLTYGIYRYVRHPMYSGIMLGLSGYALYAADGGKLMMTGVLTILFYFKSRYEERMLMERYPEYKDYRERAGRFFPRLIK